MILAVQSHIIFIMSPEHIKLVSNCDTNNFRFKEKMFGDPKSYQKVFNLESIETLVHLRLA